MKKKFFKNWKYITICILSVVLIVSLSSNFTTGKTFITGDFNAQDRKWAGISVEYSDEMSMEDWTEEQPAESSGETMTEPASSEETESSSETPEE